MGLWDFLFKKKEKQKEKISFNELENWIFKRKEENEENEKKIIVEVKKNISLLLGELKEEISILKKIDLKNRKAEERLKILVLESLSYYSDNLGKLIENLGVISYTTLEETADYLNKIFLEFNQKSKASFEKSTLLIGKELGDIRESIGRFFKNLDKIFEENKDSIQNNKICCLVEKKSAEIKEYEKQKSEISSNINEFKEKIANLNKEKENADKEISRIKKTESYLSQIKKKENAVNIKNELEKEKIKLKNLIDFKYLENLYHSIEDKMNIIKSYEKDIEKIFVNEGILELIEEEKRKAIVEKLINIKIAKEEVSRILEEKMLTEEADAKIIKIASSIKEAEIDKQKADKKIEKIDEAIKLIRDNISEELNKINISLE
jgi:hypothetical protein